MSLYVYGTIVVCGDYEGDLKNIVKVLNSRRFSSEPQFEVREKRITIDALQDESPGISPRRILVPARYGPILREKADPDLFDPSYEECEHLDLKSVVDQISSWLHRGTIEIACVSKSGCEYASFERLLIRADRSVEYQSYSYEYGHAHHYSEKYDPSMSPNLSAYLRD